MNNLENTEVTYELNKVLEKYSKQRKRGFCFGIFFLVISIFFISIGIITSNYEVFYGVPLQLLAGGILVFNNLN